jgi:hypothetical protein
MRFQVRLLRGDDLPAVAEQDDVMLRGAAGEENQTKQQGNGNFFHARHMDSVCRAEARNILHLSTFARRRWRCFLTEVRTFFDENPAIKFLNLFFAKTKLQRADEKLFGAIVVSVLLLCGFGGLISIWKTAK